MTDLHNPWDDNSKNKPKPAKSQDELDDIIRKSQEKIMDYLSSKKRKNNSNGSDNGNGGKNPLSINLSNVQIIFFAIILPLAFWLSTGFYTVQPDEEGVILRFGKYARISQPGLNYKLPTPLETVEKISVTRINRNIVGFRQAPSLANNVNTSSVSDEKVIDDNTKNIPQESQMLTGDENIVDINFDVQWKVKEAKENLFNLRDLVNEDTVKSCAESAMREVIGQNKITDILAEERYQIEQKAKLLLQDILDSYKVGIEVVRLQMLTVRPPNEVIDSYRDVQSAKADKEKSINEAYAYRNSILPRARGEAQQIIQDAEGYKQQVIATATGEADRFSTVYQQYKSAKDVTKKRMYIETMEEILPNMSKVIMDNRSSTTAVPYLLPLTEQLKSK